jgi:outer membrane receptor protein involved in Fe transport
MKCFCGTNEIARVFCLALLLFAVCSGAAFSQDITGTISGIVTDSTGAAVPGAAVTIFNVRQNREERVALTDSSGNYTAPFLPVGTYNVSVEMKGFKKAMRESVVLNVSDKLIVNLTLDIGEISEVVTVQEAPVHVELTEGAVQSNVVNGTQIRELALVTRNYEQLVALMPGVASNAVDQLYVGVTLPSGSTAVVPFSINGSRNSSNAWLVDGVDNVDRGSNQTLLNTPSIDAIDQFKVERSGYSAESGRAGGAQISVVTKSGGSTFHGDAYEFVRNDAFAANNFINNANGVNLGADGTAQVPPLRYNNFGWTFGGPVYIPGHYNTDKSKTFFFFSQEFRRVITYATANAVLPTSAELGGAFPHAVCTSYTASTCNSTSTQITKIDPVAQQYVTDIFSKTPLPTNSNTLFSTFRNVYNFRQEIYKVDQTVNAKLQVSARYMRDNIPTTEPQGLFTGAPIAAVSITQTNAPGHNLTLHAMSTLSPTWLNDAGYNYSYGAIVSDPTGLINSAKSPDIKPTLPFAVTLGQVPNLAFAGGGTSIASFGPYRDYNRNHTVFDNLTKVLGDHTLRFGFTYDHYQKTENAGSGNQGTFSFTPASVPAAGATTYEQSFANFLLGNSSLFTQTSLDITPDIRANQFEIYAQDDWKVRSNLTLNLGLRYSNFRQPTDARNLLDNFDALVYTSAQAAKLTPSGNLAAGTPTPYLDGIIVTGQNSPYGTNIQTQDNLDFAPRFGFAWDPFKTGKTSIRGGYGMFYDATLFGIYEQNTFANPPVVNSTSIPNVSLANPAGGTASVNTTPKVLHATPTLFHTPYSQQWSLEVQRQITPTTQLNVAYVGTKGTHLLGIVDLNSVQPGLAYSSGLVPQSTVFTSANEAILNNLRPYQGYNSINTIEPWFNSNYHAMQVYGQKTLKSNSIVSFSYTWSRVITDNGSDRSNAAQNLYNFHDGEYGLAGFNRSHIFNVNFVYALPVLASRHDFIGKTLGGWQLGGIVNAYSGQANTVTVSGTTAWSGDPGDLGIIGSSSASLRPDLTCDPNGGAPHTRQQWFNTSCFAPVPAGVHRPGNAGRGIVTGPGYQGWSLSLAKEVKFGPEDRFRFQLRGEAANAFNHPNPNGLGSLNPTSTLFGTISSYRDPRIVQIGLKLYF